MIQPGTRVRVKESQPDVEPLPNEFEGTFVSERTGEDGTWIELKDCSPGAPQRLVRKDFCESIEPVEGRSG